MPNIARNKRADASPELLKKRERDLYHKQVAYWKKNWGLIVDSFDEYKRISPHTKEIKKVLDIMPLLQSLKFESK